MTGLPPPPPPPPSAPAGWYADLSAPGRLRYWDGTTWTSATNPPPGQPPGWYPDPIRSDLIRYWDGVAWVGPPQAAPGQYAPPPTGPGLRTEAGDWFELSGWWRRAGGYLLDALIVGVPFAVVEIVVGLVFYSEPYGILSLGKTHPAIAGPGPRIAFSFLSVALTFAYAVWLIGSRRQTFGMQAVGITVIDPSGRALSKNQVWMRSFYRVLFIDLWTFLVGAAAFIGTTDGRAHAGLAAVGALVTLGLSLIVYLWGLGNDRNQTLIDLAAGSVVVRGDRLGVAASVPPNG